MIGYVVAAWDDAMLPPIKVIDTRGPKLTRLAAQIVAALLGAVLASDRRRQWGTALLTLGLASVFDLLFLAVSELPATVPVALALLVEECWYRFSARRSRLAARAPATG